MTAGQADRATGTSRGIRRRNLLRGIGAGLLAGAVPAWNGAARGMGAPQTRRPNIILILADDLGYGELGVQGCKDVPTPHIDSIAAAGVRFTNGYVSCPLCSPTRAGLLTGRYPQQFGFEHNPGPETYADPSFGLPREQATLAERLKALGYVTGMFGKWHLGYTPELAPPQRGFDEFFGFLSGANTYLPDRSRRAARNPLLRGEKEVEETEYLTDAFGREAVAFVEKHRGHPFFLYLPFNAVHSPLQATEKYLSRFPDIRESKRRTFAAMTAAMDDAVGRVLAKVRELKLEEDTLIIFLSDNGGPTPQTTSGNGSLRGYKGQMWEGGIRVPFMVQWKGRLPAGKTYEHPVISLDIHPTAVSAAGGTVSPDWKLDGEDLAPYLSGEKAGKPHETLCWRMGGKHAIRHGDWKLVVEIGEAGPALFDLSMDIGEKDNLAARRPDKLKELADLYEQWDARMEKPRWVRQDAARPGGRPGTKPPASPPAGQRPLEERFKELDRDGDGRLSAKELPDAERFKSMDADGDGFITPEEARKALAGRRKNTGKTPAP